MSILPLPFVSNLSRRVFLTSSDTSISAIVFAAFITSKILTSLAAVVVVADAGIASIVEPTIVQAVTPARILFNFIPSSSLSKKFFFIYMIAVFRKINPKNDATIYILILQYYIITFYS